MSLHAAAAVPFGKEVAVQILKETVTRQRELQANVDTLTRKVSLASTFTQHSGYVHVFFSFRQRSRLDQTRPHLNRWTSAAMQSPILRLHQIRQDLPPFSLRPPLTASLFILSRRCTSPVLNKITLRCSVQMTKEQS